MPKLPIVFAFDDNYRLPAWIAIKSLLDTADDVEYDIFVLYEALSLKTRAEFDKLAPINWIRVDISLFNGVPTGWSGLSTYFRLLVHELIPQYDKIIWSDVDVIFRKNLRKVYETDISKYYWGGIKAEKNNPETVVHTYFPENKNEFIYMPGFMLINAAKMRAEKMTAKFFEIIRTFNDRLKMFDLDVLNLACDKIASIPFEYCVLENIYDADDISAASEYSWLESVYGHKALEVAKADPAIIHYAGKWPKIWRRQYSEMPEYYKKQVLISPYRVKCRNLKKLGLYLLSKLPFKKKIRRYFRQLGEEM